MIFVRMETATEMPANPNLDALIPREDFEILDEKSLEHSLRDTVDISSLEKGHFFYESLKKPDFQRETANWSPEKVYDFVRTFLDGDLIPAVIVWNSKGNNFVIDGAHRLSALIAWVQDDYGDGARSLPFFENRIPEDQKKVAEKTRFLIKQKLGTYLEYRAAASTPDPSKPEMSNRARRLASFSIQLQWVSGDSKKAEESFFKINQEATPIDNTELRILRARKTPSAIAARVILRSSTGHKYWSNFETDHQSVIKAVGKSVHEDLFTPPLNPPVKTLDLPVAGKAYSGQALPLIFELVNLANNQKVVDASKSRGKQDIGAEDHSGEMTIEFMKRARHVVSRIVGTNPASLGLHPAVYFYGPSGRHQPTAFLAVVALIKELDERKRFPHFTKARRKFEDTLLAHKDLANQVTARMGSGAKGFHRLKLLYSRMLELIIEGKTEEETLAALRQDRDFYFLVFEEPGQHTAPRAKRFTSDVKSETFLRQALANPIRCHICEGLIGAKSITFDHTQRVQDGGLGSPENAQMAHPYCNTGFKEQQVAAARKPQHVDHEEEEGANEDSPQD